MESIHDCIFNKNNDAIRRLIAEGTSPNQTDDRGRTVLALAAACGYLQQIEMLLSLGADINLANANDLGYTPLIEAVQEGQDEAVRCLIEKGAELEKGDSRNGTPLLHACISARHEILRYLISLCANVNCLDVDKQNPVHYLCRWAKDWGSMTITETVNGVARQVENPRFKQHTAILEILLEHGADVNALTGYGFSPLHLAASSNTDSFIPLLTSKGADVNQANSIGFTPLHAACDRGYFAAASTLLQAGANVNSVDQDGFSPLLSATMSGNVELVKLLVHSGAEKNVQAKIDYQNVAPGDTPLAVAKKMNNEEMIKILV